MDSAVLSLVLFASITWALALVIGGGIGLWLLWRRRAMRKWIADFDRGLELEERVRAMTTRHEQWTLNIGEQSPIRQKLTMAMPRDATRREYP